MLQNQFSEIIWLIKEARHNALKAVNTELINLYWQVGEYISRKIKNTTWGDKAINELAAHTQKAHPELKGFNRRGLYRMRQFYETYASASFVSPLGTQIQLTENQPDKIALSSMAQFEISNIQNSILTKVSWTHHLVLIFRTKEENE